MIHYDHIGQNEDGTPRFHIWSDDPDRQHLVMTGPIIGTVDTPSGAVEVSPPVVAVRDEAEALAVSDAIGLRHVAEGHPDFVNDPDKDSFGFVHVGTDGVPVMNAAATPEAVSEAAAALGVKVDSITTLEV